MVIETVAPMALKEIEMSNFKRQLRLERREETILVLIALIVPFAAVPAMMGF